MQLPFEDLDHLLLCCIGGLFGVAALQDRNDRGADRGAYFRDRYDERIRAIRHGVGNADV